LSIGVAKKLGARVTAVCSSYALDHVRKLGADAVVDRAQQDPRAIKGPFDVVLDAASAHDYFAFRGMLSPQGAYVRTLPDLKIGLGKAAALFSSKRCEFITVKSVGQDLELLGSWMSDGLQVPIDARYPVRELSKALQHLVKGRVLGRIAIQVEGGFQA
jgi:NADPH:quinone reductase-like Zn-dependent oxidoreductase